MVEKVLILIVALIVFVVLILAPDARSEHRPVEPRSTFPSFDYNATPPN